MTNAAKFANRRVQRVIIFDLPGSSAWTLALLVGINMIFGTLWACMLVPVRPVRRRNGTQNKSEPQAGHPLGVLRLGLNFGSSTGRRGVGGWGSRQADERHHNKSARSIAPLYIGGSGTSKEVGKLIPRFRSPLNGADIRSGTNPCSLSRSPRGRICNPTIRLARVTIRCSSQVIGKA